MVVAVSGMDSLGERAAKMKEALQKSQTITDSVVSILGSFDSRLSVLETAMRPTQIRTQAIRKAHENIDKTLKASEVILTQFDAYRQAEAKILKGPHEDLKSYLEAIDQLRHNIHFFSGNKGFKSSDGVLSNANSLLAKAISKLEDEFKQLLALHSKPVEPDRLFECLPESLRPSSESPENHSNGKDHHHEHQNDTLETGGFKQLTLIPPRTLPLLHDLALQMVQAGNQQQLLRIYRDTRSSVMDASLRKLGVEKLSKEDVQKMQWEVLEAKIGKWIHFMRIAVKVLFVGERRVCDQIFEGFDTLLDQCFAECIASSVSMLLSFGDAIARSKRSPEKLFVLLDMYEIMRELLPEIEVVFGGKACNEIRESTFGLTKRLAQTAQETFGDFEDAVEKDATKTSVLDGTVHPLTSYVINYVKFLFDYQSTLKQLFQEFESSGETSSQLATITMRIMQALQTNLDGKSKQYRDPALMHLFLMNNIHYMVRSVRRSEAKDLLGDDWVQRYRRVVQQHANQYKRNAWSKILQCLSTQGLTSSSVGRGSAVSGEGGSGASRGLIIDRFKTFNIQFEELHQKQSQWIVHDSELREALRLAVAQVLLPAYRSFIKRSRPSKGSAAFDEEPYMKVFLSKYCPKYTIIDALFKTGGFGFVFPKGSPLVPEISIEILNIIEGDKMKENQDKWFGKQTSCPNSGTSNSLSIKTFWGLFLISGITAPLALIIFIVMFVHQEWRVVLGPSDSTTSIWSKIRHLFSIFNQRDLTSHTFRKSEADERDGIHLQSMGAASQSGYSAHTEFHGSPSSAGCDSSRNTQSPRVVIIADQLANPNQESAVKENQKSNVNHQTPTRTIIHQRSKSDLY